MTLPLFLALHLLYGTLIGRVLFARMRAEGEVVGVPLLLALAPVALLSAPVSALFVRYAGGWFLHGWLLGDGAVVYERFHLGLLLLCGAASAVFALAGLCFVIATASRDRLELRNVPLWLAGALTLVVLIVDGGDVVRIAGTQGRHLWSHPAGLLSVAVVGAFWAWINVCRERFAAIARPPGWLPPVVDPRALMDVPAILAKIAETTTTLASTTSSTIASTTRSIAHTTSSTIASTTRSLASTTKSLASTTKSIVGDRS
ncbi:MAG: hypothetical protein FJ137_11720 [Deltaproteobacteria bacterium]|nr:hypothetical protein [Deltaproteobacteria bacterium]